MILLLFLVFLDMVSLFCLLLKQQSFSISAGTPFTSEFRWCLNNPKFSLCVGVIISIGRFAVSARVEVIHQKPPWGHVRILIYRQSINTNYLHDKNYRGRSKFWLRNGGIIHLMVCQTNWEQAAMVLVYESLCFGLAFKFTKNDDLRSTSGWRTQDSLSS